MKKIKQSILFYIFAASALLAQNLETSGDESALRRIALVIFTIIALFIVYKGFKDLKISLAERKNNKKQNKNDLKNEIETLQNLINKAVSENDTQTAQDLLKVLNRKKEQNKHIS